jgi:hypothetical protein
MERIEITNPFVNIYTMQICAEEDVTVEEVVEYANTYNPTGTSGRWSPILTEEEVPKHWLGKFTADKFIPVECSQYAGRKHYLLVC